jgi:hypothetical protein
MKNRLLGLTSYLSSSPGVVVANTSSVGASLAVWLASGLLAWTGASSFAELGSAIPLNGGAQAYLSYSYGPLVSFLFAWTAIIALRPGKLVSFRSGKTVAHLYSEPSGERGNQPDICGICQPPFLAQYKRRRVTRFDSPVGHQTYRSVRSGCGHSSLRCDT